MKEGDSFYKVEALISRGGLDRKLQALPKERRKESSVVFDALTEHGLGPYEVLVYRVVAVLPKNPVLDIRGDGTKSIKKEVER